MGDFKLENMLIILVMAIIILMGKAIEADDLNAK